MMKNTISIKEKEEAAHEISEMLSRIPLADREKLRYIIIGMDLANGQDMTGEVKTA